MLNSIDTAPKDGSEIELYDAIGPLGIGHYHCDEWLVWSGEPELGWETVTPTHWTQV